MFQVPAFSIGTTMSYSVVGMTFYHRDEEPPPTTPVDSNNASLAPRDVYYIPEPTMTIDEDQASWFGK